MTDPRSPIGEDDLVAAVDGRLAPDRAALLSARIEEDPALADMALVRKGNRLSVLPVTPAQWRRILARE